MIHFALLALLPVALAAPAPGPIAAPNAAPIALPGPHYPLITSPPSLADRDLARVQNRDVISSIISDATSDIAGLGTYLSGVIGTYPSYVASGVPNFFQGFPTGSAVESSLGISDGDLAATPTQVLNIPAYANWTDQGWNLRFRGNVFKQPNISESKLDDLANIFLIGTSIQSLPPAEQTMARNLTSEIFVVQQGNVNVSFNLQPVSISGFTGEAGVDANSTPRGGAQNITLIGETTAEGDFDQFVQIANVSGPGGYLLPGNSTTEIQRLSVYTNGTDTGNATAYLVPTDGFTIVSDIDDILRVTQIYEPANGLLNSFAKAFTPWMNMPEIYANWSRSIPDFHFHYLTTTPEQITRNYMDFIYNYYPEGSFDTRPLNFSDVSATLSIRKYLLEKVFETFPERKFILIADTSNSDVMKDYPLMATEFPNQVQCIFLRNTSATDPGDKFPYDTSGFKGLNQSQYMFFLVPDDLRGLDVVNGQCYNSSIPQNVTFSLQGLPFGLSKKSAGGRIVPWSNTVWVAFALLCGALIGGL